MRYGIAHTPRTGSNWLISLLCSTGVAGFTDLNNGGYFVGYGQAIADNIDGRTAQFFDKNRTPNGVEACKIGWEYLDRHILRHTKRHYPEFIYQFLGAFDRWIWLTREDVVAQAVSWSLAQYSGIFTTIDGQKKQAEPACYNFFHIHRRYHWAISENKRWADYFEITGKPVLAITYEQLYADPMNTVLDILEFLKVAPPVPLVLDSPLKKQASSINAQWIKRYEQDMANLGGYNG